MYKDYNNTKKKNMETKQESFTRKAQLGNEIFNKTCQQQHWCRVDHFSPDEYARWDVVFRDKKEYKMGEIKVRTETYPTYILEIDKFKALQAARSEAKGKYKDIKISYINILPDNVTYEWDITNLKLEDYTIEQRWLQKNDYDTTLVLKDVIFLQHYWAKKYPTIEEITVWHTDNGEDDNLPF